MTGKKGMKRIWGIIMLAVLLCSGMRVSAADEGRVLFISSYSYAWDTVQIQIDGIKKGLGEGIVLDYEFMDTKRVDDETSMEYFYESLKYRLSQVEPYDVVIVGDDAALLFAKEHKEELFPDTPLIFEGVNDEELAEEMAQDPLVMGILEKLSVEKNIEFGLQINPKASKVVAILDNSITGEAERKRFFACAEKYPELEFSEINTSELDTWELQLAINSVSEDTILIYVVMTEDADGKIYSNAESVEMVVRWAKVPVLRMVEGDGIGEGLLGGNVVSMERSGEIAAQLATDIINGQEAGDAGSVIESPNVYCVDEAVMKKFGLDMSVLPEDTVILNHEETFAERNREALIPAGILTAVLILVILWMLYLQVKRKKLMEQLEEARSILESASQHDFLTGLPNRSKFMEDLQNCIDEKRPCTVMMLDIDNFKTINDTYGHTAGDDALRQVAARLKEIQTQVLTPYRYAGDEFIVIIRSSQSKIVEKLVFQCSQVFHKPFVLEGKKAQVCGSIGIASYPQDTEDMKELVVYADNAMYKVKRNGKNSFLFYQTEKREGGH